MTRHLPLDVDVPLDLADAFTRFRGAEPDRLHVAAHSHHYWPDVTEAAQALAWADAARLADDKWNHVFGSVWPAVSAMLARHLNLPDPATLVPAPNTFEFVNRLLSCGPLDRPMRVVSTDGEFHSFRRQIERLAEDGVIALTLVAAEPFATFTTRLAAAVKAEKPDLVFVSQVFLQFGICADRSRSAGGSGRGAGTAGGDRRLSWLRWRDRPTCRVSRPAPSISPAVTNT